MRSKLSLLLKFLGLFAIGIILLVGPEFLDDKSKQAVTDWLGEGYRWIIIGAICTAFLFHLLWTEGASFFGSEKNKLPPQKIIEAEIENTRNSLLQSYRARREAKLATRYPINLQIQHSTEGTSEQKQVLLDNRTLDGRLVKGSVLEIFDRFRGRLMIVGEPGAGKTTLLLELAEALLEREAGTLPIVINMITWRDRFHSVEEWLTELLPQIGFSKRLAAALVREKKILPLFDGLDEVAEDGRAPCLAAITLYGVANEARFVICSRIAEYASTADAPVRGEIKIRPLSRVQIVAQLKEQKVPEANGLLDAIQKDPLFALAIESPVYFNTAQLLFASQKTWDEFGFAATTVEERRNEIRQRFVEQMLDQTPYPKQDATRWLSFLSDRMTQNRLIQFELRDLQYEWTKLKGSQLFVGNFLAGLVSELRALVISALLLGPSFWLATGLDVALVVGIGAGLMFWLLFGVDSVVTRKGNKSCAPIVTKDKFLSIHQPFSAKFFFSLLVKNVFLLLKALLHFLLLGLLFGLLVIIIGHGGNLPLKESVRVGLVFGLLGVGLGMLIAFVDDNVYNYIRPARPYQRFTTSIGALHFSILQHLHLRYLLYRRVLLPWRLVDFLNFMTARHLLESDGATWRFRHQIFMDYFSEWYREEAGHKPARKE